MKATYQALEHYAKGHYCPECLTKSRLVVGWNLTAKRDEVRCLRCGRTEGFTRRKSMTEQWMENPDSVDIAAANKLADKHRDEIEAVAEGLPPELAKIVRDKYFGITPREG